MESLDESEPAEVKPAVPKKRSLFTKAALTKTTEAEDAVALFSRANELQAQRLAEEEKTRQEKAARLERKRSSPNVERHKTPPKEKRRRISTEDESGGGHSSEDSCGSTNSSRKVEKATWDRRKSTQSTPGSAKSRHTLIFNKPPTSPTSLSGRYSESLQKGQSATCIATLPVNSNVITLDDSDSEDAKAPGVHKPITQTIVLGDDGDEVADVSKRLLQAQENDDQLSDEEFPELIQKARERKRQQELQQLNATKSFSEQNHLKGSPDPIHSDIFQLQSTPIDTDPSVEILITSQMEGTIPLRVLRKLSQKLQAARMAWCDKQNLSQVSTTQLQQDVFLTWKRKRLYDSTSCHALGLKTDHNGKLTSGTDYVEGGRIHLEAWTQETYDASMRQEAAKLRKAYGESPMEDDEEPVEKVVKTRLIMKAKGMEPVKLLVKPTTMIEKLETAFRQSRKIPEDKAITLQFDGDDLDPTSTVEDIELEDMDSIEVHIH